MATGLYLGHHRGDLNDNSPNQNYLSSEFPHRLGVAPEPFRKLLTSDQGTKMSQHAKFSIDTGLAVYFCNPQSPWQSGTNENTNGMLRQYFPKGTDLSAHKASDMNAVALASNTRPRKTIGWRTQVEAFNELVRSAE